MKTYSNVVDPDQVTVVQGDTVTTPDVLGVDISDSNVSVAVSYKDTGLKRRRKNSNSLNNNILSTTNNPQPLTLNNSLGALSQNSLLGSHRDPQRPRIIILDIHRRRIRLVVSTPVIRVDGQLTPRIRAPGRTAGLGGGSLGAGEVKGLREHDHAGLVVAQIRDQLVSGLGVDGGGVTTASDGFCEAFC